MSEFDSRVVDRGDCCVQLPCPYSKQELEEYAENVQRRIDENDGELFLNRSEWHAAIILRKFIESAKSSVDIFCGHLNKNVYGDLLPCFRAAHENKVELRVMTASPKICAIEVADGLRQMDAFRSMKVENTSFPHFAVVDGCRYRLETDEADKSAVVCAFAETKEQIQRASSLVLLADLLWESMSPDLVQ